MKTTHEYCESRPRDFSLEVLSEADNEVLPGSATGGSDKLQPGELSCVVSRTAPSLASPEAGKILLKVLVVDDNVDAANMLSELLSALGYNVTTRFHPHSAIACADAEAYDVFLLDIGLPDIDEYQLAHELQQRPRCAGALFIAVTGYGSDEDRRRSAAAGFQYHFAKPVRLGALMTALGSPFMSPPD